MTIPLGEGIHRRMVYVELEDGASLEEVTAEIKAMMENFRANPPKELGGSKVILSKDYKTLKQTDDKGNVTAIDMPEPSNVLQYFTEDGSKVSVRPSGTEPKIKFYMEVQGEMGCRNCYASAESAAMEKIEAVKKSLGI
jgi:phosphoglucomutase